MISLRPEHSISRRWLCAYQLDAYTGITRQWQTAGPVVEDCIGVCIICSLRFHSESSMHASLRQVGLVLHLWSLHHLDSGIHRAEVGVSDSVLSAKITHRQGAECRFEPSRLGRSHMNSQVCPSKKEATVTNWWLSSLLRAMWRTVSVCKMHGICQYSCKYQSCGHPAVNWL